MSAQEGPGDCQESLGDLQKSPGKSRKPQEDHGQQGGEEHH